MKEQRGAGHRQISCYCLLCGNRTRFYATLDGATALHALPELIGHEDAIVACGRCRSTSIVRDLAESPGWT